jgi:hypothetical protein
MTRMFTLIALALAAAAVAAPTAQTATRPGGQTVADPLAVSYLLNQGYTPAQIQALATGKASFATEKPLPPEERPLDPLAISYLRNLGMTPAQIEEWTTGICAQANRPAVCTLPYPETGSVAVPASSDGFSWDDAGIGAGAALGAALLIAGLGAMVVLSRHHRRPPIVHA